MEYIDKMTEKAIWNWLKKKVTGVRLEGCNLKGIPDVVLNVNGNTFFLELKAWDTAPRHPLTVEQFNFLYVFGGGVLVALPDKKFAVVPVSVGLTPLLSCDYKYAERVGTVFTKKTYTEEVFSGIFK